MNQDHQEPRGDVDASVVFQTDTVPLALAESESSSLAFQADTGLISDYVDRAWAVARNEAQADIITVLPDTIFYKIYKYIGVEDVKTCRLVCRRFNSTVITSNQLQKKSAFVFDGRRDDSLGTKCAEYFDDAAKFGQDVGNLGCSLWSECCIRRGYLKQLSWISQARTSTITSLTIKNCSINWFNIIHILLEFPSLVSFSDTLDMYFWDYTTFNEGVNDGEDLIENSHYKQVLDIEDSEDGRPERDFPRKNLEHLKHIFIRRCQLADCVLYIKIFLALQCSRLETIDITTDQNVSPRPFIDFYNYLGQIIQANRYTLTSLWFPYKTIYPATEFRVVDTNKPFDVFLEYISEHNWASVILPTCLVNLSIQFPSIQIDEGLFREKFYPLLLSWMTTTSGSFKHLYLNCVYLEPGKEHVLLDCIPASLEAKDFGVWMVDTDGIPFIEHIQNHVRFINVQLWRPISTELRHILMIEEEGSEDDDEPTSSITELGRYSKVKELQFFNKSVNFKSFNLKLIIRHFCNVTHLNLVDYNTRIDRIHSSESPATIEDCDLQNIFKSLVQLEVLQLVGNMTYLTDFGITGIKPAACTRMLRRNDFERLESDRIGRSFAALRKLKSLVLRGIGIKVTDVSAYFGFEYMPRLKSLHIYGAHQITRTGKTALTHQFPVLRGFDTQV